MIMTKEEKRKARRWFINLWITAAVNNPKIYGNTDIRAKVREYEITYCGYELAIYERETK